jgi:hypothetical protein
MIKPNNPLRLIGGLVVTLICFLFVSGCEGVLFPVPYRSLAPFEGKVIDSDTKKPIEGAVILAIYSYETYGVAGTSSHIKDGQEVLSNQKGEFKLPRIRRWFVMNRGYPRGSLVIFKPGYGVFPYHIRSAALGVNKSWPPPGKRTIYEIPKLRTKSERKINIPGAFAFDRIPYENQKMYIDAINKERINVGLSSTFPVPKTESSNR